MKIETIQTFITVIDLFGHSPTFIINNSIHHKTFFGGILSILAIIVAVITTIFFSQELFLKKSPSVNLNTETNLNPDILPYFDNFEFIIGVQNESYTVTIDESLFYAKGFIFNTTVNETGVFNNVYEIDLQPCNLALRNSPNYDNFKKYNLENFYCISKNQSKINLNDIYLKEFWGNNGFQMIQIKFYECKNTTESQKCATEERLYNALSLTELSIYITDNFIRTNNYKEPFQRGVHEIFSVVSINFLVSITQYYRHSQVESDNGLMFTTSSKINGFKKDEITKDINYNRTSPNFATLTLQLNNIIEKYHRKYYKLQDLAAQVGGVYNIIMVICFFIMKLYEENYYFEYLINKYFEVKLYKKNNNISNNDTNNIYNNETQKNSKNKIKTLKFSDSVKEKRDLKNFKSLNNTQDIKKQMKINENNSISSKKQLTLKFFDKLFLVNILPKISSKKNPNYELFIIAKNHLINHIDIFSYLKHAHSDEMKSKLLLDEDQQKIFDYIFKPILSYNYIGTRYNGQNLPTKIKEKLIGATQGKQSATIKNTFDKRLNVYNSNEQNNKKKEKNNYRNYNKILNSDSNENINDENNDDNNNIIKPNENNNEDTSSN
jgi:hypothetical protein